MDGVKYLYFVYSRKRPYQKLNRFSGVANLKASQSLGLTVTADTDNLPLR